MLVLYVVGFGSALLNDGAPFALMAGLWGVNAGIALGRLMVRQ